MQKVLLFDDLENDLPADESMPFAIDGENYVIDLSAANAKSFRAAIEPYREAARRAGKHKVGRAPSRAKPARPAEPKAREVPADWYRSTSGDRGAVIAKKKEYRQRVRAWANEHGRLSSVRGTIPSNVYREYEEWAAENDVATGPASVGL